MIIINAGKAVFTGQKLEQKIYYRSTTRPGSIKAVDAKTRMEKNPESVLQDAIEGMLPHNTLGRAQMRKLHIYADDQHPHSAQNPQPLELKSVGL